MASSPSFTIHSIIQTPNFFSQNFSNPTLILFQNLRRYSKLLFLMHLQLFMQGLNTILFNFHNPQSLHTILESVTQYPHPLL